MKTKVVAYCRVTTQDQLAIDYQKAQIHHYINGHPDWYAGRVYADVAPASQLLEGSALARLLDDAAEGEFQRVAVLSVNRLAREMPQLVRVLQRFKEHGIVVELLKENISTDNPSFFAPIMLSQQQR